MNERLRKYIDELFKGAPDSARTQEYKEEILRNNQEKLNDLINEGMNEEEAFKTVAAGMGDMDELFESLKEEAGTEQEHKSAKPASAKKKKRLPAVAIVFIVIGSVITLLMLLSFAGIRAYGFLSSNKAIKTETVTETAASDSSEYEIPADQVSIIDIQWEAGSVLIRPYDGETVKIDEKINGVGTDAPMSCTQQDGRLSIRYTDKGDVFSFISLGQDKELSVFIPERLAKSAGLKIKVNTASAKTDISGIDALSIELNSASGNINISEASAQKLNLGTASGSVYLESMAAGEVNASSVSGGIEAYMLEKYKGAFETTSGEIKVMSKVCPDELDADSVSGRITIGLPEDSSFELEKETVSGEFSSELPVAAYGDAYVYGSGASEIDVETVSGEIEIKVY